MNERFRFPKLDMHARFALVEFSYWFAMAVGNYQSVYLQQQGFSASALGLINALISAVTIAAVPLWGMLSDRLGSVRRVVLITLAAGHLLYAFIPGVVALSGRSVAVTACWLCLTYAFRNPANALLDNWLVFTSNQRQMNYGVIRSLGSIGFMICGLAIAGWVSRGVTATFPVDAALMALVVLQCLFIEDCAAVQRAPRERLNPRELFREHRYTTYLIFAFFGWITVNAISAFLPYLLVELDIPGSRYGLVSSVIAAFEIPALVFAAWLRRRIPLQVLALLGVACYALSALLLGCWARGFIDVLLSECLTGIGSGLLIASSANYVYSIVPQRLRATGQAVYTAVTALAGILGNLAGGAVIDAHGATALYLSLAVVAACAAAMFLLSLALHRRADEQEALG